MNLIKQYENRLEEIKIILTQTANNKKNIELELQKINNNLKEVKKIKWINYDI